MKAGHLTDTLDLTPEEAHMESFRLASHVSCTMIKRICDKYGKPKTRPLNHAIIDFPKYHDHTY